MFQIPQNVRTIIAEFEKAGYEAYAVGGCVRDALLKKEPQDWDITTSATPDEMKAIFPKTIDTGIEHGTVTVRMGGESYEVTTYRIDGEYEDGRHPKQVQFTSNLREDLRRRDFTINAMAYSDEAGLVDMFEGQKDLEEKRIKAVGVPEERFSEDALRMLRAVRFAAQLGFTIEEDTKKGITKLAKNLQHVSKERIHTEFIKMLVSPHPQQLLVCEDTGLLEQFFEELSYAMKEAKNQDVNLLLEHLQSCKPDKDLRWTLLFDFCNDTTGEMAKKVLRRLKLDGNTIRRTAHLLSYLQKEPATDAVSLRKYFSQVGMEYAKDLVYLKNLLGKDTTSLEKSYREILENGYCIAIKDLAITGADLLEHGIPQGKEVGERLKDALELVLEDPQRNTREILLNEVANKN